MILRDARSNSTNGLLPLKTLARQNLVRVRLVRPAMFNARWER
jgi:hypothetical protein